MTRQHARVLAQCSQFRYIAACGCEGGIVHLSWDVATLHLCLQDFHGLARALEALRAEPGVAIRYHLSVGAVALLLSPQDHALLSDLVGAALGKLDPLPPACADGSTVPMAKVLN